MVLSSRDRITVSVEDRLALSAERRRLRFSFQINDVKDPTGLPAPPFCARWRRRAAYLFAGLDRVNRRLGKVFHQFGEPFQGAKITPGRRETTLISLEAIRLKLRNLVPVLAKSKRV